MAVTHYTLTATFTDLLGIAYSPTSAKVVAWVETNVGSSEGIVDEVANSIAVGGSRQVADSNGLVTWDGLVGSDSDAADINLESGTLQYRVSADYVDAITRRRKTWTSGWFSLTADIDLADVISETYVPAAWMTTATALLQTYVDSGQAAATTAASSATSAAASATLAQTLVTSDLGTTDGQTFALVTDPNSQTGGALRDEFGTVLRPSQDGAVGDKTTDDTAALAATIARLRAHVVTDPPLSRPIVLDGEGGTYKITSGLDLTGLTQGRAWEIRNLHVIVAGAGTIGLDFTAARFGRLSNVHVWGDQTNQPHTGIVFSAGTTQATDPCSGFVLDNVSIDGYYTSSGLHLNAAEENTFIGCRFWNRRTADGSGPAYAAILDGAGYKTLPAGPLGRNAVRSSFTVNKFDRCAIQKPFGIAGPAMFLQDIASVSWESCYLTAGSDSAIEWRLTSAFTPYRVYMDFQVETTGIDRFIKFTSDSVGAREIRGLHCTFGNLYTDQEVYSVHADITSLALRSFKSHIYRWAGGITPANDLFNPAATVSVYGGDIVIPSSTDLNSPASFARFEAQVVTMDGSLANWTYTPTLTNWTLGNGTLTGEYRKIGRTVHYDIRYTVGSTDVPSGNFVVSLPFATDGGTAGKPRGLAHIFDSSAAVRANRFVTHLSTTTVGLYDADNTAVAALTPFTFAAGDTIDISGSYEAGS